MYYYLEHNKSLKHNLNDWNKRYCLKSTKFFLNIFYFSWKLNFNTSTLKREDAALLLSGKNQSPKIYIKFSKTAYDILCIQTKCQKMLITKY